jgi:hypothetical protein
MIEQLRTFVSEKVFRGPSPSAEIQPLSDIPSGVIDLSQEDTLVPGDLTGLPFDLYFEGYGHSVRLEVPSHYEEAFRTSIEQDNLRVFVLSDRTYKGLYADTFVACPSDVYSALKKSDRAGLWLLGNNPWKKDGDGAYWVVIKWVEQPDIPDRSQTPDLARFYVDPENRTAQQVFTEQVVRLTPGSRVALDLLTRDTSVIVSNRDGGVVGNNALVLQGFRIFSKPELSDPLLRFRIRKNENGYGVQMTRPARLFEETAQTTENITPESDRLVHLHGADGVEYPGREFVRFEPFESGRPYPQTELEIPVGGQFWITAHTGTPLHRRLLGLSISEDGILTYESPPETGAWEGTTLVYIWKKEMVENADQGAVAPSKGEVTKEQLIAAVLAENVGDAPLEILRQRNLEKLSALRRLYPGIPQSSDRESHQVVRAKSCNRLLLK